MKRCGQTTTHRDQTDLEAEPDTDSLPDQLINSGEYEPLLPSTEKHTAAELTKNKESVNEEPRWLAPVHTFGSIS